MGNVPHYSSTYEGAFNKKLASAPFFWKPPHRAAEIGGDCHALVAGRATFDQTSSARRSVRYGATTVFRAKARRGSRRPVSDAMAKVIE